MKILKRWFRFYFPKMGKNLFFDCMVKKKALEYHRDEINILVLGSSHAKLGFDTRVISNSFNLGTDDQDLYTSFILLQNYFSKMPNLKTIILFYSLFSPGFELGKTQSYRDICLHHYIFNVPYTSKCIPRFRRAYRHRLKKFNDDCIDYKNFFGFLPVDKIDDQSSAAVKYRVAHHLRENKRKLSQHVYLDKILELCENNHIELKIVIAPVRKDFIEELSKGGYSPIDLFRDVEMWSSKNKIRVKNYFNADFLNSDFKDCDHLNASGALKLTNLLKKELT